MTRPTAFIALALALTVLGCSSPSAPSGGGTETPPAAANRSKPPLPDPALTALREALPAYEQARAALALDQLEGLAAVSSRLADALGRAIPLIPAGREDVTALVAAAQSSADRLGASSDLGTKPASPSGRSPARWLVSWGSTRVWGRVCTSTRARWRRASSGGRSRPRGPTTPTWASEC